MKIENVKEALETVDCLNILIEKCFTEQPLTEREYDDIAAFLGDYHDIIMGMKLTV